MWGFVFGKPKSEKSDSSPERMKDTGRIKTPTPDHSNKLKSKLKKEYERWWLGITILVLILIGIISYVIYLIVSNQLKWYSTTSSY